MIPDFSAFVALIVDDDRSITGFVSSVLQGAGFSTLAAGSATEALALSSDHRQRIDVLVTDVELGDGDGIEIAQRIRRERAGIRVLVISGTSLFDERAATNNCAFLGKPFSPPKLLEKVGQLFFPHLRESAGVWLLAARPAAQEPEA